MNTVNDTCVQLVSHYDKLNNRLNTTENFKPVMDSRGIWTSGFGHALLNPAGGGFLIGAENEATADSLGTLPDMNAANALLQSDLKEFAEQVTKGLGVEISDNQFAALVSFAFNLGIDCLWDTNVGKLINAGQGAAAMGHLILYDMAGTKRLQGLYARRMTERNLYLTNTLVFYDSDENFNLTAEAPVS